MVAMYPTSLPVLRHIFIGLGLLNRDARHLNVAAVIRVPESLRVAGIHAHALPDLEPLLHRTLGNHALPYGFSNGLDIAWKQFQAK